MADVLKRSNKEYKQSANTPDYSTDEWIINPDLTGLVSEGVIIVPIKYWNINGDTVSEMTAEEKAAYDAAHPPIKKLPLGSNSIACGFFDVANTGRLLEFSTGNNFYPVVAAASIVALSLNTEAPTTATVSIFRAGNAIAAISLINATSFYQTNMNVSLSAGDILSAVVVSGAITVPSLFIYIA